MTLPAQANQTTPENSPTATAPAPVAQSPALKGPRNYMAMMLLAIFALPTGLARAYRGEKSGWTRFWVYVGANVISIIPIIGQLIGGITLLVLLVWGTVDVFVLRKLTVDAKGEPMAMSEVDKKWSHGFFIYFVAVLVVMALAILLIISLLGYLIQQYPMLDSSFRNGIPEQYMEPSSF